MCHYFNLRHRWDVKLWFYCYQTIKAHIVRDEVLCLPAEGILPGITSLNGQLKFTRREGKGKSRALCLSVSGNYQNCGICRERLMFTLPGDKRKVCLQRLLDVPWATI